MELFTPIASCLYILWQWHVRNVHVSICIDCQPLRPLSLVTSMTCFLFTDNPDVLFGQMSDVIFRLILLRRGYNFFNSNLWSKFSQCYYIVTRECHISPESLCRELSKFTQNFDLVAMATLLALGLAKHGNGFN